MQGEGELGNSQGREGGRSEPEEFPQVMGYGIAREVVPQLQVSFPEGRGVGSHSPGRVEEPGVSETEGFQVE